MSSPIFLSEKEYESVLELNQEMLHTWANRIAIHYWGVKFPHRISFCKRLKRVHGKFLVQALMDENMELKKLVHIKISASFVKKYAHNPILIEKVLKHELCHWYVYTYRAKQEYLDGEDYFEEELLKIHAISQYQINHSFFRFH